MSVIPETPAERYCQGCTYPLHGLSFNRCPECGREFDPADQLTYARGQLRSPIARFLVSPMGWFMHGATVGCMVLALYSVSVPGGYFRLLLYAVLAWLALGVCWLMRLFAGMIIDEGYGLAAATSEYFVNLAVVPFVFFLTLVLVATDLPAQIRFRLSLPAMERLVKAASNLPAGTTLPNQKIGLYNGYSIETYPGGVRFHFGHSGYTEYGFAYHADDVPPASSKSQFEPFHGQWFLWRRDP